MGYLQYLYYNSNVCPDKCAMDNKTSLLQVTHSQSALYTHVQFVKKGNLKYGGPEGSHMQI